ncbi:MAG: metallophosphoesterase family protein [Alphaproteobacteria bacterium]
MVLSRLFRRKSLVDQRSRALPADTRLYAVGDIHGRIDLLDRLLKAIRFDAQGAPDATRRVLVFLGDYVDRGSASKEVMDRMCRMRDEMAGFECRFLRGNHEQWMLDFLAGKPVGPDWLMHGGAETVESYGLTTPVEDDPEVLEDLRVRLTAAVPRAHVDFMSECELQMREGQFVFVHAGIRPGVPLAQQNQTDLMWIRDSFLHDRRDHGAIVVHGHTVTAEPDVFANRIGVDTGAWTTGKLTSLVAMREGFTFLST